MNRGRVYVWTPDPRHPGAGRVALQVVTLQRLAKPLDGPGRLRGHFVRVHNGGSINQPSLLECGYQPQVLGDATADLNGDFFFEPRRGGSRMDKVPLAAAKKRGEYIEASRFGEVNSYFHLDRIAAHLDSLLRELGAFSLPVVKALVNAHHAATELEGRRDGIRKPHAWVPFQGGHYRLPGGATAASEPTSMSPTGEIHLGPGWKLLTHGALVETAKSAYRANASHNAGILYHEYGHHLTRHTADFRANRLRDSAGQSNRKIGLDEAVCDYFAASMLETPHIWAWHRRHDAQEMHPRSLTSARTMADYDGARGADPHANGTIWAAAMWDLRTGLAKVRPDGPRVADLLLVKALLLLGQHSRDPRVPWANRTRFPGSGFSAGLTALLEADQALSGGRYQDRIRGAFRARGISEHARSSPDSGRVSGQIPSGMRATIPIEEGVKGAQRALKQCPIEEIPESGELLSGGMLEAMLADSSPGLLSILVGGDVMLGGRARGVLAERGSGYAFEAVLPLLQRAPVVLVNLEGPLASAAPRESRKYSYRVHPRTARALIHAGINVVALANNHLLDCGRAGVMETLGALDAEGIRAIGAGRDRTAAHLPAILGAGPIRVGLLAYYWNRRTAATETLPGSAMDSREDLESDILALRHQVDRVVVTVHWGVPYKREISPEDSAKARYAIDCGADAVIGHHAHVVQGFEIYRDRPIFYGIGNFAFGSGNSQAESLLVGLRFESHRTVVNLFPLYVKNRDPRLDYQPKVVRGKAARHLLGRLAALSGSCGLRLELQEYRASMALPWEARGATVRSGGSAANA